MARSTTKHPHITGVGANLKKLQDAGYLLIVITNQGGIDKGEYTHKDVARVHRYMRELLEAEGVQLTDVFYCPHHSDVQPCDCRKPGTLLIEEAIEMRTIKNMKSTGNVPGSSAIQMQIWKQLSGQGSGVFGLRRTNLGEMPFNLFSTMCISLSEVI